MSSFVGDSVGETDIANKKGLARIKLSPCYYYGGVDET